MATLKDILDGTGNPLNNDDVLKTLINKYVDSERALNGNMDFYDKVVEKKETDTTEIDSAEEQAFFVDTYNRWIKNIVQLDAAQLSRLKANGWAEIDKLQAYLKSIGSVNTLDDVKKIKAHPLLLDNKINRLQFEMEGWEYFDSRYTNARTTKGMDIKHRIYINAPRKYKHALARMFRESCENNKLPYEFKFLKNSVSGRADSIVIYADNERLPKYYDILKDIESKHPDIVSACGQPPMMTANCGWFGMADEYKGDLRDISHRGLSYNESRCVILEEAFEQTILSICYQNKNKELDVNGKKVAFNDKLRECLAEEILSHYSNKKIRNTAITPEEHQNLIDSVKKRLTGSIIVKCFQTMEQHRDNRLKEYRSVLETFEKIQTPKGEIQINLMAIDKGFRRMMPFIQQITPDFMSQVRKNIEGRCVARGIDASTFTFNQTTMKLIGEEKLEKEQVVESTEKSGQVVDIKALMTLQMKTADEVKAELDTKNKQIEYENSYARMVGGFGRPLLKAEDITPAKITMADGTTIDCNVLEEEMVSLFQDFVAITKTSDSQQQRAVASQLITLLKVQNRKMSLDSIISVMETMNEYNSEYVRDIGSMMLSMDREILNDAKIISSYTKAQQGDESKLSREDMIVTLRAMRNMPLSSSRDLLPEPSKNIPTPKSNNPVKPVTISYKTEEQIATELEAKNNEIDRANSYARSVGGVGKRHITRQEICPIYVTNASGKTKDAWGISIGSIMKRFEDVAASSNREEIINCGRIISSIYGHQSPTYEESRKMLQIYSQFANTKDAVTKDVLQSLMILSEENIKKAKVIAQFDKCQSNSVRELSVGDIAQVLSNMSAQERAKSATRTS